MPPETTDVRVGAPVQEFPARRALIYPIVLSAAAFATVLFVFIIGLDWLALHRKIPPEAMLTVDGLVAVLGGLFFLKLMLAERARVLDARAAHDAMLQRLQMIADLNHHVRNALELIQFSAHTTRNQEVIRNIHASVDRIQWALRELLPPNGEPGKKM